MGTDEQWQPECGGSAGAVQSWGGGKTLTCSHSGGSPWTWHFPRLPSQQTSLNPAVMSCRRPGCRTCPLYWSKAGPCLQPCSQPWEFLHALHEGHGHRVCCCCLQAGGVYPVGGFSPEHQKAVKALALTFHFKEKYFT